MKNWNSALSQTSLPIGGPNTNCVIAGHRGWGGAPYFRYLTGHVQHDIHYFDLRESFGREQLDEMVELIAEMRCKQSGTVNIGGTVYSADAVRERFEKLNSRHIRYVIEALNNNRTKIHNIRKYLIATLFNAPVTVSNYRQAEFNHKYDEDDLFEGIE